MHKSFILCLLSMLLIACIDEREQGANLGIGDVLPVFSVEMNDGSVVSNQTLLGVPAVIVFFNTGCTDCQRELPVIEQLYQTGVIRVVCISRAQKKEEIEHYWQAHEFTMPYSPQPDRKVYELFATERIPRIYLINSQGIITTLWDDTNAPTLNDLLIAIDEL